MFFIVGFCISSFAFLDSRLESAQEKIALLNETIDLKDEEIAHLNESIEEKDANNIALGEKIQDHLATIEALSANVQHLQEDVDYISETALNSVGAGGASIIASFSLLSTSQQLIILVLLLVIFIFIISITCSIIAANSSKAKKAKHTEQAVEEASEPIEEENESLPEIEEEAPSDVIEGDDKPEAVDEAIDLLYHNNLEDSISDLGGFKFGITNFDEVLSDKAKGKSFGNSENGDFVAFMSAKSNVKKLYIIPRFMTLSDSTVALRGTTDLFTITDEGGNNINYGTVKVLTIDSPAVFALGENGWAIETKGEITALGTYH